MSAVLTTDEALAHSAPRGDSELRAEVEEKALRLLGYCRERDWAGFDPYDALNGNLHKVIPFADCRLVRLVLTQLNKRSPLNLRPLLGVKPKQNAKGIALFAGALMKLRAAGVIEDRDEAKELLDLLLTLRSPGEEHFCWGYSFPWQTRTRLVPMRHPNLVCTLFVANALLDGYREYGETAYLSAAESAADYMVAELAYEEDGVAGFAYPMPEMRNGIHNANLLAAAFLLRLTEHKDEAKYRDPALAAARWSVSAQGEDGSWLYGATPKYAWIDNFHTGFNLCALKEIDTIVGTGEFSESLKRGYRYYLDQLFRPDGAPKYYHDKVYPIDAHCVAQGMITMTELAEMDGRSARMRGDLIRWAISNLWDERGFFYYRVYPLGRNRIPFMRWTEAWMLAAFACCLESVALSTPA